jgi:hypothetical protein
VDTEPKQLDRISQSYEIARKLTRIKRLRHAYWLACESSKSQQPAMQDYFRMRYLRRLLDYIDEVKV